MGVVRGDQRIARSYYSTAARETMHITSFDTRGEVNDGRQEPVEELEAIKLEEGDSGRTEAGAGSLPPGLYICVCLDP